MKNPILLTVVLFPICMSIVSCKKEYVCKCSKIYTSGSGTNIDDYSFYGYTDTKNKAKDRCDANTTTEGDLEGGYTIDCRIQ